MMRDHMVDHFAAGLEQHPLDVRIICGGRLSTEFINHLESFHEIGRHQLSLLLWHGFHLPVSVRSPRTASVAPEVRIGRICVFENGSSRALSVATCTGSTASYRCTRRAQPTRTPSTSRDATEETPGTGATDRLAFPLRVSKLQEDQHGRLHRGDTFPFFLPVHR